VTCGIVHCLVGVNFIYMKRKKFLTRAQPIRHLACKGFISTTLLCFNEVLPKSICSRKDVIDRILGGVVIDEQPVAMLSNSINN